MKKIKRLLACLMAVSCLAGASAGLVGCFGTPSGESSSAASSSETPETSSEASSETSSESSTEDASSESSATETKKPYNHKEDLSDPTRAKVTLNISAVNAGYGLTWLQPALDAFKELDWVKEKYARLEIAPYVESDIETQLADITEATPNYDLFITVHTLNSQVEKQVNSEYVIRDLTDVADCVVPCEDVTLREKMNASEARSMVLTGRGGKEFISSIPWNSGMESLLYNETRLNRLLGDNAPTEMPRTTDELIQLMKDLNAVMPESETDQPLVITASARCMGILNTWWMQYEGIEAYENYYNLVDENGDLSSSVFAQQGRLRSLQVYEDMLQYKSIEENLAYVSPYAELANQQNRFCMGSQGVFTMNGDYFYNNCVKPTLSARQTIRFMQPPIISSIVEKCEEVDNDEKLSFLVKCIDEEKDFEATATAYSGEFGDDLPEDDYDTIYAARHVAMKYMGHTMYVREGSDAEDVAIDFIRFLATDEGNKLVMDSTKGMVTPYVGSGENNYKVPAEDFATYAPLLQDRIQMANKMTYTKRFSDFKTVYYGGWQDMFPDTPYPETVLYAANPADRKMAEDIWQGTIDFYTGNSNAQFNALVAQAQIN